MNSYVVKKEQCPKCKLNGKDNSHDNLAIFSDLHSYCFSCGWSTYPNSIQRFKENSKGRGTNSREILGLQETKTEAELLLPLDCTVEYPQIALDWVFQYEINKTDLLNNNVLWSNSLQRLIFPIYGQGLLIAWQGRYFGTDLEKQKKQKWFGKGNLRDTFNILGNSTSTTLVLTEDILSAIKVAKITMAMPLYGSFVGRERFKRLYSLYGDTVEVCIWLDFDKAKESLKEVQLGKLCGLNCRSIITKEDPKEVPLENLLKLL